MSPILINEGLRDTPVVATLRQAHPSTSSG